MVEVSEDRFEELVVEALDGIPPELGRLMDNVAVFVEDRPRIPGLLGLYEGVPLTNRNNAYGYSSGTLPLPDRITLYRLPLCAISSNEQHVVDQVRVTVIHEVAHHFGIDDDRLVELGWA